MHVRVVIKSELEPLLNQAARKSYADISSTGKYRADKVRLTNYINSHEYVRGSIHVSFRRSLYQQAGLLYEIRALDARS
jgi:hypothetical protein